MEFHWQITHVFLTAFSFVWVIFYTMISSTIGNQMHSSNKPYKVAVYEYFVLSAPASLVSRKRALALMKKNLRDYSRITETAAKRGAQIIVFPENGLTGTIHSRFIVSPYLEIIPNTTTTKWNPSKDPNAYPDTDIQREISKIASRNKIYMVVNMATKVPCNLSTDLNCPTDNRFQYSTNLVYSDDGTLITSYRKRYYFTDQIYDVAPVPEYSTFFTPFGEFATFTGFDIFSDEPAFTLLKEYKIKNVVMPSSWIRDNPFFNSVMVYSGFARAHSINLMTAGLRMVDGEIYGSGIFTPRGAKYYSFGKNSASKLTVAEVDAISEEDPVSLSTSLPLLDIKGKVGHSMKYLHGSIFGLQVKYYVLHEQKDCVYICKGDFCCSVHYEMAHPATEVFGLGVANGYIQMASAKFYFQICSLQRCKEEGNCIIRVPRTKTAFKSMTLSGHNFKTQHISAQVLFMNKSSFILLENKWKYNYTGQIFIERPIDYPLYSAVLSGRVYSRDIKMDEWLKRMKKNRCARKGYNLFVLMSLSAILVLNEL